MRWLLVISVALVACDDRDASRLAKVKDAVCACKTSSCAELAMKDVPKGDIKATPKAQQIAREMMDCLSKLYEAERPSTDPDQAAP